jgi:hypothetical protein
MTCSPVSQEGGPLISLETTAKPDTMSIVWRPVSGAAGYQVYLNGEKCGSQVGSVYHNEYCIPEQVSSLNLFDIGSGVVEG